MVGEWRWYKICYCAAEDDQDDVKYVIQYVIIAPGDDETDANNIRAFEASWLHQ